MEPQERAESPDDEVVDHTPVTVFWQRRAVVGLVLVALVASLTIGIMSLRNRAASAAAPTASPAVTASPAAADPSASTSPTASQDPSTAATPAQPMVCDVAQLVLRLTGPARVKAGTTAAFVVTFSNIGTEPCSLPLTSQTFLLRITSGSDEIWKTTDCAGWGPDTTTVLQSGQTYEWTMTWDRHRSDKCKVVPDTLGGGTYVATASWRAGPSARLVMVLHW